MEHSRINITGKKYNNLTVLEFHHTDKYRTSYWLCSCDCGNKVIVRKNNIENNTTKSCGCYKKKIQRERLTKEDGYAQMIQAYCTFKNNAKKRKLDVAISFEEWKLIGKESCYYCGSPPSNIRQSKHNSGDYTYNGIDRKDNNLGYTIENSLPCCCICNHAKSNMTYKDFINWIKRLTSKLNESNR